MARKPERPAKPRPVAAPAAPPHTVEDLLRELHRREGPEAVRALMTNAGTSNAPAAPAISPRPADPFAEKHGMIPAAPETGNRSASLMTPGAAMLGEIEDRFADNPGMTDPPQGPGRGPAKPGLLSLGDAVDSKPGSGFTAKPLGGLLSMGAGGPKGGLLAPTPPAPPRQRSPLARAGNFLDDILFGGAAGEVSARRRSREEQQAADAAHDDAFAFARQGGRFDTSAYMQRMAELGEAPDMAGLMNLEGMADSQDVRGYRARQERRGVTAGAVAPVLGMPDAERPGALENVAEWLRRTEGYDLGPSPDPQGIVGVGIGAGAVLDNERGDRALEEQRRSAMAGEQYRERDFGFRQQVDGRNFGYQRERDAVEDQYRNSRAAAEDAYRRWQQENDFSRNDVEGRVLMKAVTEGAEALTEAEALIFDRYLTPPQAPGAWPVTPPSTPGVGPQAQPQPAQQPQGDPFPGIAEGEQVQQDGVTYVRRGNQMVPVS